MSRAPRPRRLVRSQIYDAWPPQPGPLWPRLGEGGDRSAEPSAPTAKAEHVLYRWYWRARLPERHGQLFRVLARGKLNACLIEFVEDGARYVTSRNALRREDKP